MSTTTTPPAQLDAAPPAQLDPPPAAGPARPARTSAAMFLVGAALTLVIASPVLLSSQDLYSWGQTGLGLNRAWAILAPLSLDAAAVSCIAMTIISAQRKEHAGVFGLLVFVFAGVSAYVQYHAGRQPAALAVAPDGWAAFPAFSLLGPVLLHAVLGRVRRWRRQDDEEILTGAAGFGARWLVSPWTTLAAWAASRREGISRAQDAIAYVRERKALRALAPVDQCHLAIDALAGNRDPHAVRTWLGSRGVVVKGDALAAAITTRPHAAPVVAPGASLERFGTDYHRRRLDAAESKRDAIRYALQVNPDATAGNVVRWLADTGGVSVARSEVAAVKRQTETDTPAPLALVSAGPAIPPGPFHTNGNGAHQ